ncbi:hypothetical protein [Georgenia sp. Marseille-Q6866]
MRLPAGKDGERGRGDEEQGDVEAGGAGPEGGRHATVGAADDGEDDAQHREDEGGGRDVDENGGEARGERAEDDEPQHRRACAARGVHGDEATVGP